MHVLVEDFVARLTGRQTIYQMIRLAEEVRRRGGSALEPLEYKRRYHDLLWQQVGGRVEAARSGTVPRDDFTVPGSRELLDALDERNLSLYLASGTDLTYVQDEVAVLGLDHFFSPRIYGALEDFKRFSKAMIIEQIIQDTGVQGRNLIGFGDGFVEIEEIVNRGAQQGWGLGEAVGRAILEANYPYAATSVFAAGVRLGLPVTAHVGIGCDILHQHPNFDPAACGVTSYRDFLTLCETVRRLEDGVFLCAGSAVMGPEVYLKALAMARNVARQHDRSICHFTTGVFDLIPIARRSPTYGWPHCRVGRSPAFLSRTCQCRGSLWLPIFFKSLRLSTRLGVSCQSM